MDLENVLAQQAYEGAKGWRLRPRKPNAVCRGNTEGHEDDGPKAILYALTRGRWDWIDALVATGAEWDGEVDMTAMAYATTSLDLVVKLHARGCPIDSRDGHGNTPLMYCRVSRNRDVVKYLVENGADIDAEDDCGVTAWYSFAMDDWIWGMHYLADRGADIDIWNHDCPPLTRLLVDQVKMTTAEYAIQLGLDVDEADEGGMTALHHMAKEGRMTCIQMLIRMGASLCLMDNDVMTPVDIARDEAKRGGDDVRLRRRILDLLSSAYRTATMTIDELVADIEGSPVDNKKRSRKNKKKKTKQTNQVMDVAETPSPVKEDDVIALESLRCPITLCTFCDPVWATDGHVYERYAIEQWFRVKGPISPITNVPLDHIGVMPAHPIKAVIAEYMALHG